MANQEERIFKKTYTDFDKRLDQELDEEKEERRRQLLLQAPDFKLLNQMVENEEYSQELAERPAIVVANKLDTEEAKSNLSRFVEETGVTPIAISCASGEGLDEFKAALRDLVKPVAKFHHTHEVAPDLKDMPDTTGDEIPAEALRFATFLKLEKPKAKSHPSRGNIH